MRPFETVLQQWLQLQCQMISGVNLGLACRINDTHQAAKLMRWPTSASPSAELQDALQLCLQQKKLQLSKSSEQQLLLAQPIIIDGQLWGALAVNIDRRPKEDLSAALKLLKWGNTWLQLLLLQRDDDPDAELLNLLSNTLTQKTLDESAISAVNKLASRLKCERVSLGLVDKKGLQLQAISHCAQFDARSHHMQAVVDAMTEAADQRNNIHYRPSTNESTEQQKPPAQEQSSNSEATKKDDSVITRHHQELLQLNRSKAVHTFLLRKGEQVIGALTVEDSAERPLSPSARRFLENSSQIMAQIFFIKLQASSTTRSRIRRQTLGFLQRYLGPSHLTGKITASVLGLTLLICLIPAPYSVYANAQLESQSKRVLVAPQDGYLRDIHVRPGAKVEKQQLLAELDDRDLRLQRRQLSSQLQQHSQEYDEAMANYDRAEAAILNAQVEQARAKLELVEQQLLRTQLTAPMAGLVVSDDISHNLGAPVQQGQVLFEVASSDKYRVKLYIDERDVAVISRQQTGKLILTSLPDTDFTFEVSEITPLSEVREGRNYFVVEGLLTNHEQHHLLRPGMTGSGKVITPARALGWIWFHDIFNAIRLALWI